MSTKQEAARGGFHFGNVFMIRWVKRIATFAILFAWSIPGPAFPLREVFHAVKRLPREERFPPEKRLPREERLPPEEIGPKDDGFKEDERKPLQQIHEWAIAKISEAEVRADHYADSALQIRRRYPDNKAPVDVENHIQASDAARQEVKQLPGTIHEDTSEETAKKNASRADLKADEAKNEYYAADAADKMARSE